VTWQEAIATIVVLSGLGAGAFLFAQRPSFWIEFGARIGKRLWPLLIKRMSPEKEKEWRDCIRRGGEWDNLRNKFWVRK
jgi:hypothetical protein